MLQPFTPVKSGVTRRLGLQAYYRPHNYVITCGTCGDTRVFRHSNRAAQFESIADHRNVEAREAELQVARVEQ
eukprot:5748639-Prymnesium_polylepis.1